VGWRAVFPNEKRELLMGWQAAQKTEGAALWPTLFCSPAYCATHLNMQPTGPSCSAACRPPYCAARQPTENSCFSFGNMAL